MSKNKPKETIEYVIRLQDKERQLLDDLLMSYRIQSLDIVGLLKILEDPFKSCTNRLWNCYGFRNNWNRNRFSNSNSCRCF